MIDLHDNFAKNHGNFIDENTNCEITYKNGGKVFKKTTLSHNEGGHRIIVPRLITPGYRIMQKFSIDDFHPGPTNQNNSNIMFYMRWQDPQTGEILNNNGWGLYIRPDGAVTMAANEEAQGPVGPIESDVRYTTVFDFDEEGFDVRIWGGEIPLATKVGRILGDLCNPNNPTKAWLQMNVISPTTVRLYDVKMFDIGSP